jgi:tetratricopeptide (TPR) repeat protein
MPSKLRRRRTRRESTGSSRLRQLRTARGLTQAQLAGEDFTKAFISQLETGTSKLSLRAAQLLAGRLGVPVSDLLEGTSNAHVQHEAILAQAERELASGSPEFALRMLREMRPGDADRGRALRLQGRALFALDKPRDALKFLNEALAEFRGRGQADIAARTLYDIALAHARLDESEEGLLTALECGRALRAGDVVDRTLQLQVRTFLASTYVRRGDFAAADLQIERALELAKDIGNREAQAALYASLAKSEQDRGNLDRAVDYWQQSMSELENLGREHAVAETWNNLALVYVARGQTRKAREAAARAGDLGEALGHRRLQPWLEITRAKIALQEQKYPQAEHIALAVSRNEASPLLARAEALIVVARALVGLRAPITRISRAFDEALEAASQQPGGTRARVLRMYADALEAAGETKKALQRMQEAMNLIRPVEPIS